MPVTGPPDFQRFFRSNVNGVAARGNRDHLTERWLVQGTRLEEGEFIAASFRLQMPQLIHAAGPNHSLRISRQTPDRVSSRNRNSVPTLTMIYSSTQFSLPKSSARSPILDTTPDFRVAAISCVVKLR